MKLDTYQKKAQATAVFDKQVEVAYTVLGLINEAGEVAGKYKKLLRGDYVTDSAVEMMREELGDVLWYVAALATALDASLDDVAKQNLNKLESRMNRGMIKGDGDHR